MATTDKDRARGVLIGLACGDALGRAVEFKTPDEIQERYGRLTEMIGDGTWNKPPGTITDDTDMALCIARSLVEQGQFDPADIADRFVGWYEAGPFDIGGMTRRAIELRQQGHSWDQAGQQVWEASPEGQNAGNGSVMRCAPLAVAYADYPCVLARTSIDSSQITHADPRCTLGCAVLNLTIAAIFDDVDRPLDAALGMLADDIPTSMLESIGMTPDGASGVLEGGVPAELRAPLQGILDEVDEASLETSGYVVTTLQTALYDALSADSFEDAVVSAVNRGGDADTIGAIAGAVAGARFGASPIPDRWLEPLESRDELDTLAKELQSYPQST